MSTGTPRHGLDCTTHTPITDVDAVVRDYGNAVTLSGDHAEIARRIAAMHHQRLPITAPREYRSTRGWKLHTATQDESLADMLDATPLWPQPGSDTLGLPMPEADRLFWEWANWSPPIPDPALADCPHTATATPPPAEPEPTPQRGIFDAINEAIAWSHEQQRNGPPATKWFLDRQWYSQKELDARFLELRQAAQQRIDEAVRGRMHEMYEGQFTAPDSQKEADAWEQERRRRIRNQG